MNNLLDLNLTELTQFVENLGEPKFRAKQLYNAMLNGKNFNDKTVLPNAFLEKLKDNGNIMQPVKIFKTFKSKDKTIKFLYKLTDDNLLEGVLMQHSYGKTLCVSTQVGCKMNCAFCASGLNFVRNLTAGEILGQIVAVNTFIGNGVADRGITNIVLMGSGEPLDNFDNVVKFLKLVTSDEGFNFSVRNITLSTCGIPSKIEKLADIGLNINLAISLHAPNNEIRKTIMPVAKSFPIESVIEAANHYHTITNRKIYIEYTLIDGVNSSVNHARELAELLSELNCRVNLITLNDVKERGLKGVTETKTNQFLKELLKCGISATIRRSLGDDVDGACGQLRNKEIAGEKSTFEKPVSAVKSAVKKETKKPANKVNKEFSKPDKHGKPDNFNKNNKFGKPDKFGKENKFAKGSKTANGSKKPSQKNNGRNSFAKNSKPSYGKNNKRVGKGNYR